MRVARHGGKGDADMLAFQFRRQGDEFHRRQAEDADEVDA
jgi:hypothetical protein